MIALSGPLLVEALANLAILKRTAMGIFVYFTTLTKAMCISYAAIHILIQMEKNS